jgi:hypothetical protein
VRGLYSVLVVKPEGKIPLGRPRQGKVDNIKTDLWGESSVYGLGCESVGKETVG